MSHDQEKKKSAKNVWWTESEALQKILSETALKVLGEKEAMKYIISSKTGQAPFSLILINEKNYMGRTDA